jgi:hypothetical protein
MHKRPTANMGMSSQKKTRVSYPAQAIVSAENVNKRIEEQHIARITTAGSMPSM